MTVVAPPKRFDPKTVRSEFPILQTAVTPGGPRLVYLDNGATTQKPQAVIDAVNHYYEAQNANIHRGVYRLSQTATEVYETARKKVAAFLNAADERECIFVRGTTEGINLVASAWGGRFLKAGDEIVISALEHHSNIVPWQIACEKSGATLRVIPVNEAGELDLAAFQKLLSTKTKLVAVTHLSNALGTIVDVKAIARLAHGVGAKVLVDGAQWVAHHPTDVQNLDADFYVFSGHKLFGPTGIGVLYGKRALLESMPPYMGGGDMIESVTFEKTTYAELPNKFEAGTPDIAGAAGLSAAIDFLTSIGFETFASHEQDLLDYATRELAGVPGLRIVGNAREKGSVISFVMENPPVSSFDIGIKLDADGIAVRTGHHCCQPLLSRLNLTSTARASFALYNTRDDVDALVASLKKIAGSAKPAAPPAPAVLPADAAATLEKAFAAKSAGSPAEAAEDLISAFEMFDSREEKNVLLNELGGKVPPTFEILKRLTPRIPGCMSEVHLLSRERRAEPGVIEFAADVGDSASTVRGLIAVLQRLYSGQKAGDILAFDLEAFFRQIGLDQFLSTKRRNGLAGMVDRIHQHAKKLAEK